MTTDVPALEGIMQLRRRARRGSLDPVARHVLDRVSPGWDRPALDARWEKKLTELSAWVAEHAGRFPRMKGTDRDQAERSAGDWLRTQKHIRDLSPARAAALDSRVPGWNITIADQWQAVKAEAIAWTAANSRFPAFGAEDPDERRVAASIRAWQKYPSNPLNDSRCLELDREYPGWRQSRADTFLAIAVEYAAWTARHQDIPAVRAAADADERRLAAWLNNARNRWLRDVIDPTSVTVLDELIPGWRLTLRERRARR